MIKKPQKQTLASKISDILSAAPTSFDPEDNEDETAAKFVEVDEENEAEEELLSKFRKQNISLLEDVDERYAGKKGSRKSLRESESEGFSDSSAAQDEESADEEAANSDEAGANSDDSIDQEGDASEEESQPSDCDASDYQDEDQEDTESNFQHFKDTSMTNQMKKGLCVRNQMNIWENLLEIRIQLQKCLLASNRMPQNEKYKEIVKESDGQFSEKVAETKKNISNVLDKLLELQQLSLKKFPETRKLGQQKPNDSGNNEEDDEEIPSDTEEEKSEHSDEEVEDEVPKKRRKLKDYEEQLNTNDKKYKTYRDSVIQKWNDKTRIGTTKNFASYTVLNQIQHNLTDSAKLIKRTQLRRSDYKIVGEADKEDEKERNEYNTEIFDDDDFYHQLLRELIEVKSADITDPVQLGRQWIQLQNLRSKMKKKVDTKATKGRKIRYAVHSKLVNFMAPIEDNQWTDEAKNELYGSLFGRKQVAS